MTRHIADLWGELLAQSDEHVDDTGLVATARVHGLILVTRNLKHVSGRGAMALDPFKSAPKITKPYPGSSKSPPWPSPSNTTISNRRARYDEDLHP